MPDSAPLKITALHGAHKSLNARLVPFAGYDMPVQYTSIIAEARAVRTACGMFDVSHMGRVNFQGEETLPFLEYVTTNDVARLHSMGGEYSLLPNEEGGCVDDIILYRLKDKYQMVVNASNHEKAVQWLGKHAPPHVQIEDITDETCMIAVQGPDALAILSKLGSCAETLESLPPFGVADITIEGINVQAARSGYTGEDGFELTCPAKEAGALWLSLHEGGVVPCGLGARDTLRVEAGLPLYGHELNDDLSPIAAGLGWVISKTKSFLGSEIINQVRQTGPAEKLIGVKLNIKRLISPDMKVLVDGEVVGSVTSGVISPTFDTALALAFVNSEVKLGTECLVEARGKNEPATIVSKRFYKRPA